MRKLLFSLLLVFTNLSLNGIVNSPSMLTLYRQHFAGIEGWYYIPFVDMLIKLDELQ